MSIEIKNVRILRLPEVLRLTGLGRSSCYRFIAQGRFPRQVELGGGRAVGWIESEILAWILSRRRRCG
ncbi:AlpA family phage regulatory protein [Denitromonas ohlonensis]|uniref:AlpA family transcriptional regulator n=2 Tax=Denitromonas TaxID=139331 RepID=A0A558DRI9_9RHOO|nr:AlpA family transcriptional regulator [Denitromonas ohlonensis]TVT44311.1 MAG: AlpA family transcriptional regulator [Denitromonas halophila]TVO63488.1 AlpA family transcriptional regulator [Denitromonas ohlonensis]TVO75365.1 AlpA family transcriptional regulator [Denitromonas ohlonensis]TVT63637.1 MAG: AlpA family transcriptional regulator [Denitromonas halophila]TVT68044.1 MAG: AlpA family transcriptional regulator [Denitromonas halophila]